MAAAVIRAKKILEQNYYATIATSSKAGMPWNSPVAHVYDQELNIYWFSDKESRHSRNVRENEHVFIAIFDSTLPEGKGEGLYFQAQAVEVTDPDEITFARRIKKGQDYDRPASDFLGDAIRRVYKATPTHAWVNDAEIKDGIFIRDFRRELSLEDLRKIVSND